MFSDSSTKPLPYLATEKLEEPSVRDRPTSRLCRTAALSALISLSSTGVLAADPQPVENVERVAADWVKARIETTRIETEWGTQRQLLESTVNGLSERAQTLEIKRDYLQAKTAKDREELANLAAMDKTSVASLQGVEGRVQAMSTRLLQLRPSLPPRLSTALEMSYRSLAAPSLTVSERMQLNVTVLTRCAQFNRAITSEKEVVDVGGGGSPELLEVVYWGLSHGYALNRTAGLAWLGFPGPQGWKWEPHPDAAGAVAKLIAIHDDKADPDFVTVPARVALKTSAK